MRVRVLAALAVLAAASVAVVTYLEVRPPRAGLVVTVSTTTSLYQMGALEDLLEDFRNSTHLDVQFKLLAKGSGEALRLLADGSACLGFVHAPSLELQYSSRGEVERAAIFAYNEFVVVGPRDDPANVSKAQDAVEAFRRIYAAGEAGLARFVSRGDESGTYIREVQIWRLAGLNPEGRGWYLRAGQGMVQTLLMAENLGAYTLTDTGTWYSLRGLGKLRDLTELKRDFKYLVNVYSLYISKSSACSSPDIVGIARKLGDYLKGRGQDLLSRKYSGLLNPVRGCEEAVLRAWESLAELG